MSGSCSCECVLDATRNKVVSACGAHAQYTRREIAHVLQLEAKALRDSQSGVSCFQDIERPRFVLADAVAKSLEEKAVKYHREI